jgi:hypothetical protein
MSVYCIDCCMPIILSPQMTINRCYKCAINDHHLRNGPNYSSYCYGFNTRTPITCVSCFTEIIGLMKMHLIGPHCINCHIGVVTGPPREYISTRVRQPHHTCDMDNHRLCDIMGCNVYGMFLNSNYRGLFCNQHYKEMQQIRKQVKDNPNTMTEYYARMKEINIRKTQNKQRLLYAYDLLTRIFNTHQYSDQYIRALWVTPMVNESESRYINRLFLCHPL